MPVDLKSETRFGFELKVGASRFSNTGMPVDVLSTNYLHT